jgi:adenylate cyclase
MKKIHLKKDLGDEQLAEACGQKLNRQCSITQFITYTNVEYTPSQNTVAIVVDMRDNETDLLHIFNTSDNYEGQLGSLDFGQLVLVYWQPGLKFIAYGGCRVAEVTAT